MKNTINISAIEKKRIAMGITRYKMSQRLEMSRQSYYDFLKRKSTTIVTLCKIGDILNMKIEDMIV